jgi:hypothetical protein
MKLFFNGKWRNKYETSMGACGNGGCVSHFKKEYSSILINTSSDAITRQRLKPNDFCGLVIDTNHMNFGKEYQYPRVRHFGITKLRKKNCKKFKIGEYVEVTYNGKMHITQIQFIGGHQKKYYVKMYSLSLIIIGFREHELQK